MSDLRKKLIRLAHQKPELRDDLLPLISKAAYKRHPLSASKTLWKPLLQLRFSGWQLASEDFWNRKPVSREGFHGVWEKRFEIPQVPRRGFGGSKVEPWATSNSYGVGCSIEADDQGNAKAIMGWHGPGMFENRSNKRTIYTQTFPNAISGEGRQVSLSKDLIIWVQATFKKVEKDIAVFVKEDREEALGEEYQRSLYAKVIRLAHQKPHLRRDLLPLIQKTAYWKPPRKLTKTFARQVAKYIQNAGGGTKQWLGGVNGTEELKLQDVRNGIGKTILSKMSMGDLMSYQSEVKRWTDSLPDDNLRTFVGWVYDVWYKGRQTGYVPDIQRIKSAYGMKSVAKFYTLAEAVAFVESYKHDNVRIEKGLDGRFHVYDMK